MPTIGVADILVRPSFKGLQQTVGREMDGAAKSAGPRAGAKMGSAFGSAFKGGVGAIAAVFAVDKMVDFFKTAVKGAGDLEQSVGAIESVFKGSAGQMQRWSKDAAKNVGLTSNEFNELGALIGSQLKNGGTAMEDLAPKTKDLIGLGADLSSMFGGTAKDAVGALSSALKGERDPIEKYGVSLNQAKIEAEASAMGFSKVGKSFEDNAIQAATLSLIMKQTKDAHGNFAKEGSTFAGAQQRMAAQWGNLTAKIGELFLPMLTGVIGFLSDKAMPVIGEVIDGVKAFAAAFKAGDGDITSSGLPGFMERVGDAARGLYDLFTKGDYTGALFRAFQWEEDSPVVDKILDIRDAVLKVPDAVAKISQKVWDMKIPIGIIAGLIITVLIPHWVALGIEALKSAAKQKIAWTIARVEASKAALVHSAAVTKMVGGWVLMATTAMMNAARIAASWLIAMGPVGWLILAIVGIGAAVVAAYNNIGWFRDGVDAAFKWVKDAAAGAFEAIKGAIGAVVDWFTGTVVPAWDSAVKTVGDFFNGLWTGVIKPVFDGIRGVIQGVSTWFSTVIVPAFQLAIGFLVGIFQSIYLFLKPVFDSIGVIVNGFYMLFEYIFKLVVAFIQVIVIPLFMTFWNRIVEVFTGIGTAISGWWDGVVAVFNTVVSFIRTTLSAAFTWFRDNVITPVWNAVTGAIKTAWTNISNVFNTIVSFIRTALSSAFTWFRDTIITPVFNGISNIVKAWWNGIVMPVFTAVKDFVRNVLGPAFTWLRDNVIKPVWDGISSTIKNVWEKNIKPVFDTISNFIKKNIPDAFKAGVGFVKTQWEKLQEIVKAPIRFVVQDVINKGLIDGLNGIGGLLGIKPPLPHVALPKGFMDGGYTGDGPKRQVKGPVHAGEFVFTKEQTAALGKNRLAQMARAAVRGDAHAGHPMAGSLPFIQGPLQSAIARTGALRLKALGAYPESDLATAARAWNGRAGVRLAPARSGMPGGNTVGVGYGAMPVGGAIGYYSGYNIAMARNNAMQRQTIIHEVGHALGLHHNSAGAASIMHPMLAAGNWPTAYDTANLRRLYGAPGSGARPASDDGGDGGGWNPIADIIDGLVSKFKEMFKSAGFVADIAIGIGKKLMDNVSGWVGKKLGFGGDGAAAQSAPFLHDNGGVLNPGLSAVLNATRKPEAIYNHEQNRALQTLAARGAQQGGGDVHVHGNVGWMPDQLAREMEVQKRRTQTMSGMTGVVFA